ncbi:PQQ-binding-like beta-propeller repeat protein [Ruania albidiflava]|uniref:outer membrane protein assembly factor BamB family protein n=1 Tax=Ruania albidiflava TaxID=366586 RepID=UPI0003B42789|nr:PQQ-binding-like beta-propeller repeat protein [Ruania albidiflava]
MTLAAACTMPQAVDHVPQAAEIPAEVVWERDLPVVGNPAVTDDVAVVYTADDDGALTLVGVSTVDGSTLWEHPAGRGAVRPSLSEITPTAFVRDDRPLVAYLDPDTPHSSTSLSLNQLVLADLETGETIGETDVLRFISSPELCADRASVCVWVTHSGGTDRTFLDVESMELRIHPYQFQGHAGQSGVQHIDGSGAYELVRFTDEGTLWAREVEDLPGGSELTDIAVSVPEHDVDWLAIGLHDVSGSGVAEDDVRLDDQALVLLDRDSGELIWSGEGYALDCPNTYLNAGVRCSATGVQHNSSAEAASYSDLDVTLEGFTEDGTTTWTLPLGDAPGPLAGAGPSVPGDRLVLTTAEDTVLLDPDSGHTMPVPADWTFLCGETAAIEHSVHWDIEEPEEDTWSGGQPLLGVHGRRDRDRRSAVGGRSPSRRCAARDRDDRRPPWPAGGLRGGTDTGTHILLTWGHEGAVVVAIRPLDDHNHTLAAEPGQG